MAEERIAAELRQLIESTDVPPDELAELIGHVMRSGQIPTGSNEVLWGQLEDEVALRLVYPRSGRFSVILEPALRNEDARELIRLIHALESGGDPIVWRTVLFAAMPVDGFFRYNDRWQIRPVPSDAPRPPILMAPHPFLLEVKGMMVSEPFVRTIQAEKLVSEAQLLLALVLQGGVLTSTCSPRKQWVIDVSTIGAGSPAKSVFGQVGYVLPSWPGPPDELSDVSDYKPLTEVPSGDYFRRSGIRPGDPLEIPDLLTPILQAIDALALDLRERFFRAAYWYSRSHPAWYVSRSLSYIALINAIEALTPRAIPDFCPTCRRDRAPGPTARFRDVVERYAGHIPNRGELYALRSKLVHGEQLLISDGPSSWDFTPQSSEESQRHEFVSQIAKIVLIKWLCDAIVSGDDAEPN